MEALNLNARTEIKQLPASSFPMPADIYVCDQCGRDITTHLHRGRAHVRKPLGPSRFICRCGAKYPSGAAEWDDLSEWEKRQWLADVVLAIIVFTAGAIFAVLAHYAIVHRNPVLLVCLSLAVLLSYPLFPLFIAILTVPFKITASIWRTRVIGPAA